MRYGLGGKEQGRPLCEELSKKGDGQEKKMDEVEYDSTISHYYVRIYT